MKQPTIGLGILSWKGYTSLRASLDTLSVPGFLDLFDEKMIFFPEIDDEARGLAANYQMPCTGSPQNLGIYGGFRALAEAMTSDFILLLENDLHLIESVGEAELQIKESVRLLHEKQAQVVHLRSRTNPGEPFSGLAKFRRYHPPQDASLSGRFVAATRRMVRPTKARRLSGTAPYAEISPEARFSDIKLNPQTGFLTMPTALRGWTNQPFMINRNFYLETILDRVEQVQTKRLTNGFKNIEIEVNGPWWREKNWTVAVAPGLFHHARLEDRGY